MDKYLLEILKESNTIIIPGLGAITITNADTGETMFMSYLRHDDGKLAEFIAEKDGIDEATAKNMVAKYVREIQAELDKGETYSMFELGSFVKADDGDIEFTHWSKLRGSEENTEEPVAEVFTEQIVVEDESEEKPLEEPKVENEAAEEVEMIHEDVEGDIAVEEEVAPIIEEVVMEVPSIEIPETPDIPEELVSEVTPERKTNVESLIIDESSADTKSEVIEITEDELNVKHAIEEALQQTAATKTESIKEKKKGKRSTRFWIFLIALAILIVAGGYVGWNYQELKQHIPFLADAASNSDKDTDNAQTSADDENSSDDSSAEVEGVSENDDVQSDEETEEVSIEEPAVIESAEVTESKITVSSASDGPYHIIAGAFSSIENANRMVAEFKAQGLPSKVINNGGLNAVSMQSFATMEEANANLAKMRGLAASAWILHK